MHREMPIMGLDDGSANRQAHARTLGFGRKERMEDAVHVFRINSGPGVFHHDQHAVGFADHRFQPQRPGAIGDCIHCFNSIRDQIGDNLLQLDPIRQYRRKLRNQLRLDQNLMILQLGMQYRGG